MSYETFMQDVFGDTRRLLEFESDQNWTLRNSLDDAKSKNKQLAYEMEMLRVDYDNLKQAKKELELSHEETHEVLLKVRKEYKSLTLKLDHLIGGIAALGFTPNNTEE
jgi:chromosome segregation ATPase